MKNMSDDRDSPATEGDLKGELNRLRDDVLKAIRDSQTEVLKAIHGLMQTVQNRIQERDETMASLERRMSTIESRMLEIEKRLNMPPTAA
jgi:predicted  nucleic acid-binding Zn-ribbon protein